MLPLDNRAFSELGVRAAARGFRRGARYAYRPGATPVPEAVAANIRNRSHLGDRRRRRARGRGGRRDRRRRGRCSAAGRCTCSTGGCATCTTSAAGSSTESRRPSRSRPGATRSTFRFDRTGDHQGHGNAARRRRDRSAEGDIPHFTPNRFSLHGAGLSAGRDASGLAVTDDYEAPFPFSGTIVGDVVIEVDGVPFSDPEAEIGIAIATQ